MLKRIVLFLFVVVPCFLTIAFYLITGKFYNTPHFCPLTKEWKYYVSLTKQNDIEQEAENILTYLNDGLTDDEERQIIEKINQLAYKNNLEVFFQYLSNKKFDSYNGLELIILRFNEAIPQTSISVEFLWKSTFATLINSPHPRLFEKQPNQYILTTFIAACVVDSSLTIETFEKLLSYNAYAWTSQAMNRDTGNDYYFTKKMNFKDLCLTERTLLHCAEKMLQNKKQANKGLVSYIYQSLEIPLCNRRGNAIKSIREKIRLNLLVSNN